MEIAATYGDGMISQQFGRTEQFKIYDVEGGNIVSARVIDTNGTGHGALAGFLRDAGVEVLLCGGIGMGARDALAAAGIRLLPGVTGSADEQVGRYLAGTLEYAPNVQCHHHDQEHGGEHDCHHGGCGAHGCH